MVDKPAEKVEPIMVTIPRQFPSGDVVAVDVSEKDYMQDYAEQHHEWVEGVVIKMSPVSSKHDKLTRFLDRLLGIYLATSKQQISANSALILLSCG